MPAPAAPGSTGSTPPATGPGASSDGPRRIYEERLGALRQAVQTWHGRDRALGFARLATVVAGLALAWVSVQQGSLALGWVLVPVVLFVSLMIVHERVVRRRERFERSMSFYEGGLRRLEGDTSGGTLGVELVEEGHLFAHDIDLFGEGSIFQLVSRARTLWGERTLASWLQRPCLDPAEIEARQEAVAELRGELDLRERLASRGAVLRSELDPDQLSAWLARPRRLESFQWLRFVLPVLGVANAAAVAAWLGGAITPRPLLFALVVQAALWIPLRPRLEQALVGLDRRGRDIDVLAGLVGLLEDASFESSRLQGLQGSLVEGGASAAQATQTLRKLVDWAESRRNAFFAPFSALLFASTQITLALERWRTRHGEQLERWFVAVGEVEALASLASHAFENPTDPFPEILRSDLPIFDGRDIAHPLIPRDQAIGNDLHLAGSDAAPQALIVSGSNMSGKSTFLRSCGVNLVLALAGGPVRAAELRLTPLDLGASITTHDSLQDGASRFYAEIVRLRDVLECARERAPALFLLDEILHGTNSHDRKIGAEALVQSLVGAGALGLVTTHDLALAEIGDSDPRLANVHFVDHLEDGKVCFDYVLHEGVVTRSNAIELMREVGLEV